jgi:hypothetical protein
MRERYSKRTQKRRLASILTAGKSLPLCPHNPPAANQTKPPQNMRQHHQHQCSPSHRRLRVRHGPAKGHTAHMSGLDASTGISAYVRRRQERALRICTDDAHVTCGVNLVVVNCVNCIQKHAEPEPGVVMHMCAAGGKSAPAVSCCRYMSSTSMM